MLGNEVRHGYPPKGEGQHEEEGEEEGAQKYKERNQINELIIHEGWCS